MKNYFQENHIKIHMWIEGWEDIRDNLLQGFKVLAEEQGTVHEGSIKIGQD